MPAVGTITEHKSEIISCPSCFNHSMRQYRIKRLLFFRIIPKSSAYKCKKCGAKFLYLGIGKFKMVYRKANYKYT
jgi:C4-type Zn-finger protein